MANDGSSRPFPQATGTDPKTLFTQEHEENARGAPDAQPQFLKTLQLKSEPEPTYWTLFTRFIFWPFVQGVMIGLGQYGTKYVIHHYFERKPAALAASTQTDAIARQRS